jgi:hypothetical protein
MHRSPEIGGGQSFHLTRKELVFGLTSLAIGGIVTLVLHRNGRVPRDNRQAWRELTDADFAPEEVTANGVYIIEPPEVKTLIEEQPLTEAQ